MHNLVQINEEKFDVTLDIRYASKNNFTGDKIYKNSLCYLHSDAVRHLKKAIAIAKSEGYKIKIFDCFRPIDVQEYLFNTYPDDGFISNPKTGVVTHCRGIAIDLTLVDEKGKELDMGTEFDNFTDLAYHNSNTVSEEAQKNRKILMGIMLDSGWDFYKQEWWHYQLFNPRSYPIIKTGL